MTREGRSEDSFPTLRAANTRWPEGELEMYVMSYEDGRPNTEHRSIPAALKAAEQHWYNYTFQRTGNHETGNPVEIRHNGTLVATIKWRD
jgi:hypothetical protein